MSTSEFPHFSHRREKKKAVDLLVFVSNRDKPIMASLRLIKSCVFFGLCPDSVARESFSSFSSCRRGEEKREDREY